MKAPPIAVLLLGCALSLVGCSRRGDAKLWAAETTNGGDFDRGKAAIMKYGCIACHTIEGMRESKAMVGPPLTRMASRSYLAGNMQNNAANLIRFIRHPREVHNDTAMPEMGVTESDARDIAAYLYSFN
jgi:cytochrome c